MVIRDLLQDPPHTLHVKMSDDHVKLLAEQHIEGKRSVPETDPLRMIVVLGGSGAGKSTLVKFLESHGVDMQSWVLSGLDEYLDYVPEYLHAIEDNTVGYMTAADGCYSNAISIAKAVNEMCAERRINVILEETGKDIQRTIRYIKKGREEGRHVLVALVDNDPNVAISRALSRFQVTGRYSSPDYIRGSFMNVFNNYHELKRLAAQGEIEVNSFIYIDNGPEHETRCWLDSLNSRSGVPCVLPSETFCQEPLQYRPHFGMLKKLLADNPVVKKAYEDMLYFQHASE
eukprot:TRINITY_DN37079_c0_g2_i1.p1 TRINITY_DN37079_c0_g2~~TRINITY_DN37079_c0_g2_i1.p1  ORF type:complete len:326 (+),score=47.30 TRINITY_DN37079_c0_g2_i1:118-978(+)